MWDGQGDFCYGSCVMDVAYFYGSQINQYWLVTTIDFDAFSVFIIFSVKTSVASEPKCIYYSVVHTSYMYLDDF